mmetsp:Transcript_12138/g.25477  ORF Transcript_12138/g.25477 Transcript_12138/m.25477 type:complete len:346 (+) Transcript_12138:367-1404(+)|eukprot:CAMPEP_0118956358 /NCGR_PEP_ID=MMETSP1169-20130426/61539_1 /TAXON_ID=36882 /ORGANISM="Pyramimonas obovata, Strain CCMP722" /LENGTH=345 /DNA_ID=CAMNT_0006904383 /DNA_START=324 /DNA_END=1361 /DNA_ORIENTATION=-
MLMPTHQTYPTAVSVHAATLDPREKALGFNLPVTNVYNRPRHLSLRRAYRIYRSLNKECRRLLTFILLNLVYLVLEASYGVLASNLALVSDAFHLGFGCCVLSVSLLATFYARKPADSAFSYGYHRAEVLSAFTNMCFLLFMSFSSCVEALHSLIEPESEHQHYLMMSSCTNLIVNLVGVIFFRKYARVYLTYRSSQDMNMHAIFLHVASDSARSGGTIFSLWLLAVGVPAAEAIVAVLVGIFIAILALPLFNSTARILLQGTPETLERAALAKCLREAGSSTSVLECRVPRFWALRPGALVGTLVVRVTESADEQKVLQHIHSVFETNLGHCHLTVQVEKDGTA